MVIGAVVIGVLVLGILAFMFRNWPEEHRVSNFFTALVNKDYKTAYGIWIADKNWESKPPLTRYPFADFYRDWGPAGEWGPIRSFKVDGSSRPHDSNTSSNGVVVVVYVNERREPATIFVDKNDHTFSFSPFEVVQ